MNKAAIEAMLPEIQNRYDEATTEAKRLEGEFRRVQTILNNWIGEQAQKGQDATDKEQPS